MNQTTKKTKDKSDDVWIRNSSNGFSVVKSTWVAFLSLRSLLGKEDFTVMFSVTTVTFSQPEVV